MSNPETLTTSDTEVFIGIWTDWQSGSVRGSTITLSRESGNLLIATLALFVGIAGTCFWRIVCFGLHYYFSSRSFQDGLYHQRQAILRNAANSTVGLFGFLRLTWSWRKSAANTYRRTIPVIALAICILAAFAVASIFSSHVSSATGNEVLLVSRNCGWVDPNAADILQYGTLVNPYASELSSSAADYAQRCYSGASSRQDCPIFVQTSLESTSNRNFTCPFNSDICLNNTANIQIDTGFIDSSKHLGINTEQKNRFAYRRVTECAPIKTEGHSAEFNFTNGKGTNEYVKYLYGYGAMPQTPDNETYEYPKYDMANVSTQDMTDIDYTLTSFNFFQDEDYGYNTNPVEDLIVDGADGSIYFLSANDIVFMEEVNDPMFAAHNYAGKYTNGDDYNDPSIPLYFTDAPVTVMACTHRHQVCNPSKGSSACSALTNRYRMIESVIHDNVLQNNDSATNFHMFLNGTWYSTGIYSVVEDLSVAALAARSSMQSGLQGSLPDNQWQLEVEHWHDTTLATLQRAAIEMVNGPSSAELVAMLLTPTTAEGKALCNKQKVYDTAYSSFSVLGLTILLVLSGAIILLSYALEFVAPVVQRRNNLNTYQRLEWVTNETLQLQRLVHEELGVGTWTRTAGAYPVTEPGERLAALDLSDMEHPRLTAPPKEGGGRLVEGDESRSPTLYTEDEKTREQVEVRGVEKERSSASSTSDVSPIERRDTGETETAEPDRIDLA